VGPVLVLCLIVAGWLFGATHVWGTGYATKVRWSAAWTYDGGAWQWSALLAVALAGALSLGLAVRAFADDAPRRAWTLAAVSGVAFAVWSAVVRYSVVVAIFVFIAGFVAIMFLGPRRPVVPGSSQTRISDQRAAVPLLLAAIVIGLAWAFYALVWLVIGPEGSRSCNCWADRYNDTEYFVQLLVAVGGAVGLVVTAVAHVMRQQAALRAAGGFTAAAICVWLAFVVTGSG
jgi:hypothetical protein